MPMTTQDLDPDRIAALQEAVRQLLRAADADQLAALRDYTRDKIGQLDLRLLISEAEERLEELAAEDAA